MPPKKKETTLNFSALSREDLDTPNSSVYSANFSRGLSEELIRKISSDKNEPKWLLEHRLRSLQLFYDIPTPSWGPDLSAIDFETICFYALATDKPFAKSWEDVDPEIKSTFERLKIPEAEAKVLAGVGAQYESENIYHSLKEEWQEKGVIFEDFDRAVQEHEELVKKYFMKCVPANDHKFAALHGAVFSGGTFLFVPKGVSVTAPLQAYFRMNAAGMGQFEHTLIIIEENAQAQYIEGCSAPKYGTNALHAGCVEVFVAENAQFRYSSVENWSKDTYNLNTKRAIIGKDAQMEWIGGNMGSAVTMLYPASILAGKNARANHLSIAVSGRGQNQDTGAKVTILGEGGRANIVSKSISKDGGVSTYRGSVEIKKTAKNAIVNVQCDALLFDQSISDTIPKMNIENETASVTHEASAGKISLEILFYLETRGLSEEEAKAIIVNGFLEEIVKNLPLEYASELNRLIELEMEGSIG
jgi:Fe-S cluster assembly protein SufB